MFLRCCKQAFTYFVFRLVALIISYQHIRSCRAIQHHNGLVETISHTVRIELHCNQLECLLNWACISEKIAAAALVLATTHRAFNELEIALQEQGMTCHTIGAC